MADLAGSVETGASEPKNDSGLSHDSIGQHRPSSYQTIIFGGASAFSYCTCSGGSAPTITIVSPTPGTEIQVNTPIVFDVVGGFALVAAQFEETVAFEVVHDGQFFTPRYGAESSSEDITGGVRFTVRRLGGWPRQVTLRFYGAV